MKKCIVLPSLLSLGLLFSVIGCNDPASVEGNKAQTAVKTAAGVKIGDTLSAANFSDAAFAKNILENDKTVIVDFTATWCGPCKMLKPILHELEEEGLVHVEMIDTDEHPEIAKTFGVQGIPHLLFVKNGKLVETATGYQEKKALVSVINNLSP